MTINIHRLHCSSDARASMQHPVIVATIYMYGPTLTPFLTPRSAFSARVRQTSEVPFDAYPSKIPASVSHTAYTRVSEATSAIGHGVPS